MNPAFSSARPPSVSAAFHIRGLTHLADGEALGSQGASSAPGEAGWGTISPGSRLDRWRGHGDPAPASRRQHPSATPRFWAQGSPDAHPSWEDNAGRLSVCMMSLCTLTRRPVIFCCHDNRQFSLPLGAWTTSRPSLTVTQSDTGQGRLAGGSCVGHQGRG